MDVIGLEEGATDVMGDSPAAIAAEYERDA